MSASAETLDTLTPERKLSGATLLVLAFVMGTLFALLPMYYLYTTRSGAGRSDAASPIAAPAGDVSASDPSNPPGRFAARMTYELSHTPAEPPPVPVRVAAKAEPLPKPARESVVEAPPPRIDPSPRVSNARPIIAAPPDPRDTTREMEREARRPEYREPPRQVAQVTVGEIVQPKVIEGRDFVLPGKPVATKPIAAPEPEAAKPAVPARTVVATAPVVPGASPIGGAPEAKADLPKAKSETKPKPEAADLASRFDATREWLAAAPQATHTIQLMGTSSEEHLRERLKALTKLLDPSKIYVFRTVAQGKPSITVVYGSYADRQAALQALEKLPAPIAANKPVLRTVNGIRTEQKQHGTS